MNVLVNGKPAALPDNSTLQDLLKLYNIAPELIACEINLNIVRRKDYPQTLIKEGDKIEILRMIGGG